MKKALVGLCVLGLVATSANAAKELTNEGIERDNIFAGHVTGTEALGDGAALLYAPSEADDPGYRAALAAAVGGSCDYYDGRAGVPTVDFLLNYSCVIVWANFAFLDNVAYGDVLADYVDAGGSVVLGSFCTYTSGNFLSGRIMTDAYCPVVSPTGSNHFTSSSYVGDGTTCIHDGVGSYETIYRDILALQGSGAQDGSYADGEIAAAYRDDFAVIYSNGSGSSALGGTGDWATVKGNSCQCTGEPTPTEEGSWGSIKARF
jgi:hypothetical protein